MQIYDEPVWKLMHEMVDSLEIAVGDTFKKDDVIQWFSEKYPKIKIGTISAHLIRLSTNAPTRIHYKAKPDSDDLFYKIDGNTFRLFDRENDPTPIYGDSKDKKDISLEQTVLRNIREFERSWSRELDTALERIKELEDENEKLRAEVTAKDTVIYDVNDDILKDRISRLGSAPSDTIIREAGVVLEDRLRVVGDVESTLHGASLVDAVLSPDKGVLIFSSHPGEQDGVRMLYRGAMQFIRNPPMHKLIEYSDRASRLFIRLIDSLLQLITELEPRHRDQVSVDEICLMLTRRQIPKGQKNLYQELSKSVDEWVSATDLATGMGIDKSQLAGVLGALGRRINNTKGLEGGEGSLIVLDINREDDEWFYRMRPILRDALEIENII
ncbi:MAG: hypothetical protein ISS57_04145 [Anaerolineales bacterium]|nr:hypothetical protein [Anaerolineales bacterium]